MRYFFVVVALLALVTPTYAQQQTQSASATALQINGAVGSLAIELDQSRQVIQTLQKQLADARAKIEELEKPKAPSNE